MILLLLMLYDKYYRSKVYSLIHLESCHIIQACLNNPAEITNRPIKTINNHFIIDLLNQINIHYYLVMTRSDCEFLVWMDSLFQISRA